MDYPLRSYKQRISYWILLIPVSLKLNVFIQPTRFTGLVFFVRLCTFNLVEIDQFKENSYCPTPSKSVGLKVSFQLQVLNWSNLTMLLKKIA